MQYHLDARREDFSRAFEEVVNKAVELKPEFMIIAGDLFEEPRPSNQTLATTIRDLKKLRDNGIKVLAVDGSHDSAPNIITGTILTPLDKAGLLYYLPIHDGACWRDEDCYIYGIPNYRTRSKVVEKLPEFFTKHKPTPAKNLFNVFVFHGALDDPKLKPYGVEAELNPDDLPDNFDYYAGGHIHRACKMNFKSGLIAYSGCLETTTYEETGGDKGFYYVKVDGHKGVDVERVKLTSSRPFLVVTHDFSGKLPSKITEEAVGLIKASDTQDALLVMILEGVLPSEARRADVNLAKIRNAATKALYVHVVNKLEEVGISEEVRRTIFGTGKDIRVKAYEYFLKIFSERHSEKDAQHYAKTAIELIDPLLQGRKDEVKKLLEGIPEK
jgi:DNA repair exonuclease SbcCD nuclease subunit